MKSGLKSIVYVIVLKSLLFPLDIQAQGKENIKLNWNLFQVKKDNAQHEEIFSFDHAFSPASVNRCPIFYQRIGASSENQQIQFYGEEFEPFNIVFSDDILSKLTNTIKFQSEIVWEKKKPFLEFSFIPVRKNPSTGKIERLVSFSYKVVGGNNKSALLRTTGLNYAEHSVLSSGKFYKIGLTENGIYKISYSDLQRLGMNPAAIDPKNLRVYGYGGMVAEPNSSSHFDDLPEVPVKVIGEQDGRFDNGDYLIFYAQGPHQWKYNSSRSLFERTLNPYSDSSFYFISSDQGPGKRVVENTLSPGTANQTVTSFNDFQIHQNDRPTLVSADVKSGRAFFGEEFDIVNSYNFNFSFPQLDNTSAVFVKTCVLGRAEVSNSFSVKLNGNQLYNLNCRGVQYEYDKPFGDVAVNTASANISGNSLNVGITYNQPNSEAHGFLNFIEVNVRRALVMDGDMLSFRDMQSVGSNNISDFALSGSSESVAVWNVSDPHQVFSLPLTYSSGVSHFTSATSTLQEFIAFNGNSYLSPALLGAVSGQDLHHAGQPDFIIVAPPVFLNQANRLADFRRTHDQLEVLVVTPQTIYNEFSSGAQDASAIRNFMKMLYDRAGSDSTLFPRFLLLFGDGSYDNKNRVKNNTNYVVTFQSRNSWSRTGAYVTDDYFSFLDDNEGGLDIDASYPVGSMDMAVGRLPVQSPESASEMVDKIIHYASSESFGDWRNMLTLIADDENSNLHLDDAEDAYKTIQGLTKKYNFDKIYFDAYQQISTPGGSRYPDVNIAINEQMNTGCLLMNYIGHGGEVGLGHERIMSINDINSWSNFKRMPLLFTATCSFSRWDDPAFTSAGELTLLNKKGGAIALFTTTRTVYSDANHSLNQNFLNVLFNNSTAAGISLGEIFMKAKNMTGFGKVDPFDINNGDVNTRNFSMLGDPSILFALPKLNVETSSIQTKEGKDSLKAGSEVTISGVIKDKKGTLLTDFNGTIYPTIYDKADTQITLANDQGSDGSYPEKFLSQKNIIYKGKASVKNGTFNFSFIVPKDISYIPGNGRISYYTNNNETDGNGFDNSVIIGGSSKSAITDKVGPSIRIFLNDEKFVQGGMSNMSPTLLVKLADESGINTVGKGIGHDLTATLTKPDGTEHIFSLNNFYEAKLDNYKEGEVNYLMNNLSPGHYKLKIKAWDVFNNSNDSQTDFYVAEDAKLKLDHLFNYPNPFTTSTNFQFEHNRPGDMLDVQIRVFTPSGKVVKSIHSKISATGNRVNNLPWDGCDDFGDKLGRGVYIYRLKIKSSDGSATEKYEKLVIL